MMNQVEIVLPTPILNTPDFLFAFGGKNGNEIPVNEKGHSYLIEFVALPGMVFSLLGQCSEYIYRVSHPSYSAPDLFLDIRFSKPGTREKKDDLPSPDEILRRMKMLLGKPYIWGGNWSRGIPELLTFYPPKREIESQTKILWTLEGVDCSGLLYEATRGVTPRNTSQLINFGKPLKIKGMNLNDLISILKPLDMIIYVGHVLFILDEKTTIESKSPFGVIQRDLTTRLEEILQERQGVDEWISSLDPLKTFLIRRIT